MFSEPLERVCMFENTVFYRVLSVYVCFKTHRQLFFALERVERVCMFENHVFCRAFCNSNSTGRSQQHRFLEISESYTLRYYINTSILRIRPSH